VTDNGEPPAFTSEQVVLTVVRGPRIEGPATVHEGASATLEFKADDLADGWTIEWEKDGLQLAETTATLVIGKATQNDEGTYTVTAFSPAKGETLTASFHLDVLANDEATPLTLWPLLGAIPLLAAWRVRRRK
jgi:hypothetical protein